MSGVLSVFQHIPQRENKSSLLNEKHMTDDWIQARRDKRPPLNLSKVYPTLAFPIETDGKVLKVDSTILNSLLSLLKQRYREDKWRRVCVMRHFITPKDFLNV